jgi:SAM-dependent methyltransferase
MTRGHAPAAERNRGPLLEVLRPRMCGPVLELAAGTGQHARWFSDALELDWTPSDRTDEALASIAAWRAGADSRLRAPLHVDLLDQTTWPAGPFGAVLAVNLIHISPWPVTERLFELAARTLRADGRLFLYGPYRIAGEPFVESNVRFDAWLKERDPRFGVRELAAVEAAAEAVGFALVERIPMPANNQVVCFGRPAGDHRSGTNATT